MHRPPLYLLLFAATLIGTLAVAQPYIVADPPNRFDDPIVAAPAPAPEIPAAPQVEVDKLPVTPAPPVVAEAPEVEAAPEAPAIDPPVARIAPSCDIEAAPRHAEARPAPRGDGAALAAREMLSWGVFDDLLEARGERSLPVPLGDAPLPDSDISTLPCAMPRH